MRRSVLAAVAAVSLVLGACSEQLTEAPAGPEAAAPATSPALQPSVADASSCTSASILSQIDALFPLGSLRTSARSKFGSIPSKVAQRTGTAARDKMFALVDFILKTYYSGKLIGGTSSATQTKVFALINSLYCYVRLDTPTIPAGALGPDGAVAVVTPSSPTTLVITGTKTAGVNIPAGAVPTTTTVAITRLPDSSRPLLTSLDQYPLFYEFLTQPTVTFNLDVTTGVCQSATFEPTTFARLRIAHNVAPYNFGDVEILPRVTAGFLDCSNLSAPSGPTIGMLKGHDFVGFASAGWHAAMNKVLAPAARTVFLPDELHAAVLATCCLGGTTRKFSPFGAVDPTSNPATLGYNSDSTQSGSSGRDVEAPPSVLVTSKNGTPIASVPVVFTVTGGGGTITGGSSTEPSTTDTVISGANGIVTLSAWTLGSSEGDQTVTATAPAQAQFGSITAPYKPAAAFSRTSLTFTAQSSSAPSSGGDVVVFNDLNMFDNYAAQDSSNARLFKNLVDFTATGPRASATRVLIHLGHGSLCITECPRTWTTFVSTMSGQGYSVTYADDETAPLTTLGSDVKVVILVLPTQAYSDAEINALKAFASEGGRIQFVGEFQSFYGDAGIAVENEFLTKMGAQMQNTGGQVDCVTTDGYPVIPESSLRAHQVTTGLAQLTVACASVVQPGPDDYPLVYDTSGEFVLSAVAKVDLTPLTAATAAALRASVARGPSVRAEPARRSQDSAGRRR